MEKFERLERKIIARGTIIDYCQDTIKTPSGHIVTWDFIDNKGASAVIPVREDGKIFMVRQYRNALERETLEIPAGGLKDRNEDPKAAAARELEEEIGYTSDSLTWLLSLRTTVAFCNEKIDIYVADNLKKSRQNLDEDEVIEVEAYSLEELCSMIYEGKIEDSKTIAAIMGYKNLVSRQER